MSIAQQMKHFAGLAKVRYVEQVNGAPESKVLLDNMTQGFVDAEKILTCLNKTIGAEVVGAGHGGHGSYVFGKDGVPWGALIRRTKTSPRTGESKPSWELYSRHINKQKGTQEVTKSGSVTGLINYIRKGIVKPDTMEDMFAINIVAASKVKNLDIGKTKGHVAAIDGEARHDVYWYIRDMLDGHSPELTKPMLDWEKYAREGYEKHFKMTQETERTKQAFRTKSIILTEMPFACDKAIHVQFMTLPVGAEPQITDGGFISKIEDLVEYPHITGISNLVKLERGGKDDIFDALDDYDYIAQYNLIRFRATNNAFIHTVSLVFPAEFMEAAPQEPEKIAVDNNGKTDIFSLDI
jgi:hypothetical protein